MNGITMDQWMKIVPDSVVNLPEGLRNLLFQLYQTFIAADRWKWFLNGLKITFAVTIGATDPRCYHRSADRCSPHGA